MAVSPAYSAVLKRQGTSTVYSNEATTKVTANTVYRITDAAKRVQDPTFAPTVEVDADGAGGGAYATAAAGTYTWDPLSGTVTFASDQGSAATVRVSGKYLPMLSIAEGTSYKINLSCNLLDKTTFDSGGRHERLPGLFDVKVDIEGLKLLTDDMDPGGGTKKFRDDLANRTVLLIEIAVPGATTKFRAWVHAESGETAGAPDDILKTSLSFCGAAQKVASRTEWASWGWAV